MPVSPHAAHSDVRGSLLFKPSSLIPEEAEGSRVNGAPRSRALIGGKGGGVMCPDRCRKISSPCLTRPWAPPLHRRFSRPPDRIRFLPAINLESGGPRSTLITTRSPQQGGFGPAAPIGRPCQTTCARMWKGEIELR